MLHQVVPGAAQDGSRHLTLHRDTEQPPPPPRQTRLQTDAHTLRQPPASLMQKLWDERHSIRAPSAEHLGTQAVQLAEAAFLDFVVSKQVVTNSSIQECAILGRAAGPAKACSSDWAKASGIHEQGKPACNGQTGHQEIQAPSVPRVDGDVCVTQHPPHVPVWHVAPGFLEHLSPGSDDTLMPGIVSPRSAAGSSVVAVWVDRSPAPFTVFPSAASGQTQPTPQSTKKFGIAQAECVGGGDGGQL